MNFIDGRDHESGPRAYEMSEISTANGQDGAFLDKCEAAYELWSEPRSWSSLVKNRWQARDLAALSFFWGGKSCKTEECTEAYSSNHVCFCKKKDGEYSNKLWTENCIAMARSHNYSDYDHALKAKEKKTALSNVLQDYYDALASEHKARGHTNSEDNLILAFPHLIRLYTALAAIHPFIDGNSRTRLFVLQTELVRLGGHPIMIEGSHAVYAVEPTDAGWEKLILDGWCMYEAAVTTGRSPYVHTKDAREFDQESLTCRPKTDHPSVLGGQMVESGELSIFAINMSSWSDPN